MNVYVWNQVERCTNSYHPGGGVVVFADSIEEARALANKEPDCVIKDIEVPDEIRECADGAKKVFVMPDAGCC